MAVGYNPRVVTDGLVLSLDAGNPKNYNVGISTNWTDKVGGNNGTLVGGTYHNDGPFVGAGYVEFDGTGDYLSIADNADLDFDTGDFTCEAWVYVSGDGTVGAGSPNGRYFYSKKSNSTFASTDWVMRYNVVDDDFGFTCGSSGALSITSTAVEQNRWYHVAATRESGTVRLFVDGVLQDSGTFSGSLSNSNNLLIGFNQGSNNAYFEGFVSNSRIVKGTALYTSNFTPPTKQLTAVTNTTLLTCQGNTIADASSSAHTITANGDAAANLGFPASAFEFDGTDDYVITTRPNSLVTGGSISVSLWAKWTTTGTSASDIQVLVDNNHSSSPAQGFVLQDRPDLSKSLTFSSDISANGVVSTFQVGDGTWHHIVGTNDQITTKLYIDGSLDAQTSEGGLATVQPNITIGYWQFTPGRLLNGNIAQVSIYNRALTAAEVEQNYNATKGRYA
jgi:hypothetical protein